MRTLLAAILALSVGLGCTAAVRYSAPPGGAQTRPDYADTASSQPVFDDGGEYAQDDSEPTPPKETPTRIDKTVMNRVISRYLGVPYQSGGSGTLGLDCSGLVYCVYRDYDGTRLPLNVQALYRLDERVGYDDLTYGDLIFFRINDRRVSHVAIYLDNGKFIHASESRGVVVDDIRDEFFASRYAGGRRIH